MKIYQAIQKLLVGDTQTHTHIERERERERDRQTGDLITLLSFLESTLKISFLDFIPPQLNQIKSRGSHSRVEGTRKQLSQKKYGGQYRRVYIIPVSALPVTTGDFLP
jgi:hypothetical protein